VPAQQSPRGDDQAQLADLATRQQPGQPRQDRPVGPRQPRDLDLALEDSDLMAEDQDLGVLGTVRPGKQGEPAEHTQHRQVGESHRHEYRQCPTVTPPRSQTPIPGRSLPHTTGQVSGRDRVIGTHTFPATLTTPALNRRSLQWFGLPACTANPEDLPPSLAQHGSCRRPSTSPPLPFQDTPPNGGFARSLGAPAGPGARAAGGTVANRIAGAGTTIVRRPESGDLNCKTFCLTVQVWPTRSPFAPMTRPSTPSTC
jgi:hypothetical protein